MSQFLYVEFNIPLSGVQSVLYKFGILKTAKTSNLKAHNNEKMAVKESEPYFNMI